jgi:hypothetical protein
LARYPLTDDLLTKVTSLKFDGGATVYRFAWYFWDGEDEIFTVHDLTGIERCQNLASLSVASMIGALDIRRLASLPKLERLDVDDAENLEALIDLKALRHIGVMNNRIYNQVMIGNGPTRRLFEALKARGVRVFVQAASFSGTNRPPPFE